MAEYFRALATDLDGTLAEANVLNDDAIDALDVLRADGRAIILVTGRIAANLEKQFPGLSDHFDAVVTENGAVLSARGSTRVLAPPVDSELDTALADQNIPYRRGQVLLACDGAHTAAVSDEVQRLGLDYQLVHNRTALMVLPAGVSKGRGLFAAAAELGLSHHNVIAIGDAENDLSLLQTAEIGVCVGNGVSSLRAHADLVLGEQEGSAVAALARGPLFTTQQRLCPTRRWMRIGAFDDCTPALIPGSQATILVSGASGSGKSYVAGLLVEQWVEAGYNVLILDPEGDHSGLHDLPGILRVDAELHLPTPHELVELVRRGLASTLLDLTALEPAAKVRYLRDLLPIVDAERVTHGMPHWIVIDEAHLPADLASDVLPLTPIGHGVCLVTYRPELLPDPVRRDIDITITVLGPPQDTPHGLSPGRASLADSNTTRSFTIGERRTGHVRHLRKYAGQQLPPTNKFYFHDDPTPAAGNAAEFSRALQAITPETLSYHAKRGDFSRWVSDTLQDSTLGMVLAEIEHDVRARTASDVEHARTMLKRAVSSRYYLGTGLDPHQRVDD